MVDYWWIIGRLLEPPNVLFGCALEYTMMDDTIFTLPPLLLPTLPPPPLLYEGITSPIIIDNGATTFRWGFSAHEPRSAPSVVAKYKERRNNKPLLLFGEAVDCETGARGQARTPWEGDVLLNFDALVCPRRLTQISLQ
jgi:actin-related protein 5